MSDIKKLRSVVREEIKSIMAEKQPDGGLDKLDVKLPAQAQRFLDKAVSAIKGAKLNRRKQIAALAKNIPLRRIATINEQVGPILFLCSDLSAYMTGAVIDVNGGQI